MPAKLYRRGRHGNNVVNFEHPTRHYDEVTGLFINIDRNEPNMLGIYCVCWRETMEPVAGYQSRLTKEAVMRDWAELKRYSPMSMDNFVIGKI